MRTSAPLTTKFINWLDERTQIKGLTRKTLDEPIRGGARWAYVFGSTLLFLFGLQIITGIFLAMYYVPSADHAHASVAYIQKAVPGGALVRGLHHYSAHAMIIVIVAHLAQTFLFGAYKAKRELLWVIGGVMLVVVLGFAFTGYLLPWDQDAYFGTKVGTSIAGEIPVVGSIQQRIMLGGSELTSLTLSRFFMTHVFLLPLALGLFAIIHFYLFRKAKPAGHFHQQDDHRVEFFYPRQLFKDAIFVFMIFAGLLTIAATIPAKLGPQADPTADFLARPPWYFLPLFQLLKYFPGKLALIPTVGLPMVLFGAIFLLPFFDKRAERHPLKRPLATAILALTIVSALGLIGLSKYEDRSNPEFRSQLKKQEADDVAFLNAPFQPQEIGRAISTTPPDVAVNPAVVGSRSLNIFLANCANCHGANADGGTLGPSLINLARRRKLTLDYLTDWIAGHGREPSPGSMPRYQQLSQDERQALADWILRIDKPLIENGTEKSVAQAEKPPAAYVASCAFCHGDSGEGSVGPALFGVSKKPNRSCDDLLKLLDNARAYGLNDPMPASFPELSAADKQALVEWLSKLNAK
ncbi:MAG: cytochrome b N-terminal domain-containing protein [Acidobacteriota bacterium]